MDFQENIKNLRKDYNMSQEELSKRLGIARSSVANYENGQNFPNMSVLLKIADVFNCSVDYLIVKSQFKNYKSFEQALKRADAIIDFGDMETKKIITNVLNNIENSYHISDIDAFVANNLMKYNLSYKKLQDLKTVIIALYESWLSNRKEFIKYN